jgi:glutaredoxin
MPVFNVSSETESFVMTKELVMYSRTSGCPYVTISKKVLSDYQIPYREVFIDVDAAAKERLLDWVGFLSVPTLVVANAGEVLPYEAPEPLERGLSPRGIDRGSMLTEPNASQLKQWLSHHAFIAVENV